MRSAPGVRDDGLSAFADLMVEADALGVTKCVWETNLRGIRDRQNREGEWSCRATVPGLPVGVVETEGRTGEEALRRLVEFLKAVQ